MLGTILTARNLARTTAVGLTAIILMIWIGNAPALASGLFPFEPSAAASGSPAKAPETKEEYYGRTEVRFEADARLTKLAAFHCENSTIRNSAPIGLCVVAMKRGVRGFLAEIRYDEGMKQDQISALIDLALKSCSREFVGARETKGIFKDKDDEEFGVKFPIWIDLFEMCLRAQAWSMETFLE